MKLTEIYRTGGKRYPTPKGYGIPKGELILNFVKMIKKKTESLLDYYGFTKAEEKKYSVVCGILKELTPERIEKEIEEIKNVELPAELQKWVKEYEKVGERDGFIWKWLYNGDKIIIESFSIRLKYYFSVMETIFLYHMFTNLIDDASEKHDAKKLLKELLKIPFYKDCIKFNHLTNREKQYLIFTIKVWCKIERNFKKYPYYKKIKKLFKFDVFQLVNATKYVSLICIDPLLINKKEYWMYLPQNMQFNIAFDLYSMCSIFDLKEIGKFRESVLYIQKILRIGNDLGTWEREIKNNDFANSMYVYLIDSGVLFTSKFKKTGRLKIIEKIKKNKIERQVLKEWEMSYRKIKEINKKNKTINIIKILSALEKITFYHLLGRGIYKKTAKSLL